MLKFPKQVNKLTLPLLLHTSATINSNSSSSLHQRLDSFMEKCSSMSQVKTLHAQIILRGLTRDTISLSKLISFCALSSFGDLHYAHYLFEKIPHPNRHMYNTLIRASSSRENSDKAIFLYKKMVCSGIFANEFTFPFILKACALQKAYPEGVTAHLHAVKLGFSESHICVQNGLINFYVGCGKIDCAGQVFDFMEFRTLVSWNSMMAGYAKMGWWKEAFLLFSSMRERGVEPDEKALDVFLNMPEKNVVSWNTVMNVLALHGYGHRAIELFQEMEAGGIRPDAVTFSALLSACCHCGLVEIGRYFFSKMGHMYKIPYDVEHYACMIDILGRGGLLKEALELVGKMEMKPDIVIWGTLLGACRTHRNVSIAKLVLKQLLELEPYAGGLYVLMSNIFCEAEQWDEMKKMRKLMKDHGVRKSDAVSSIEVSGRISDFMVDDNRHESSNLVYTTLNQMKDHLKSESDQKNLRSIKQIDIDSNCFISPSHTLEDDIFEVQDAKLEDSAKDDIELLSMGGLLLTGNNKNAALAKLLLVM
ncbi:Pentatricopeptide repeat-containing protein, chloroplastic [Sesamum alatum]|uniref:Pentatricopeptide repeat-containing protein, chloroplastic n=1 Tax=Sesamum alatum TaxID=300844 RepID=A0AAE1YAR1_9LAMI|nr:Pentatricopeptide repeat-containing protein, chloroplastic [Sesamum alatum]